MIALQGFVDATARLAFGAFVHEGQEEFGAGAVHHHLMLRALSVLMIMVRNG